MRPIILYILLACLLFFHVNAADCQAAMYSFTDSSGVIHFTNVPTSPKYKPIWGKSHQSPPSRQEYMYDSPINDAARLFDLDPSLIKAVIKKESNFNPHAVSSKGAVGLMQLMPDTALDMNVTDRYDPRENIFGGSRYLKRLSKIFAGDLDLILASYNAGPDKVMETRTIPDITETKRFVKVVRQYYNQYKKSSF